MIHQLFFASIRPKPFSLWILLNSRKHWKMFLISTGLSNEDVHHHIRDWRQELRAEHCQRGFSTGMKRILVKPRPRSICGECKLRTKPSTTKPFRLKIVNWIIFKTRGETSKTQTYQTVLNDNWMLLQLNPWKPMLNQDTYD